MAKGNLSVGYVCGSISDDDDNMRINVEAGKFQLIFLHLKQSYHKGDIEK